MRLGGCLLWLLGLLIVLVILALLFGGFQKGTKVNGTGPPLAKPCQPRGPACRPWRGTVKGEWGGGRRVGALGGPGVVPRTAQPLQVSSVT